MVNVLKSTLEWNGEVKINSSIGSLFFFGFGLCTVREKTEATVSVPNLADKAA
jgi:hypothetical protein